MGLGAAVFNPGEAFVEPVELDLATPVLTAGCLTAPCDGADESFPVPDPDTLAAPDGSGEVGLGAPLDLALVGFFPAEDLVDDDLLVGWFAPLVIFGAAGSTDFGFRFFNVDGFEDSGELSFAMIGLLRVRMCMNKRPLCHEAGEMNGNVIVERLSKIVNN